MPALIDERLHTMSSLVSLGQVDENTQVLYFRGAWLHTQLYSPLWGIV